MIEWCEIPNDETAPLYAALFPAMMGYSATDVPEDNIPVDDFLEEIFLTGEAGGEPGWQIELLKDEVGLSLFKVWTRGEEVEPVYDEQTFWTAVQRCLIAFAKQHPHRTDEVLAVLAKYGLSTNE